MKPSKAVRPLPQPIELDPVTSERLSGKVALALLGSGFRARERWPFAVVILRESETRATSRGDFAAWLRANDLPDQATECLHRRVPAGSILVWLDVEMPSVAATGFVMFDLAAALRPTKRAAP